MLRNLEIARKDKGVTLVDIADLLRVRYQTISDKIQGKFEFKFSEAVLIQKTFFPEYDLVFLFTSEHKEEIQ
ncbi:helix-turn-helix domain-containing protein [Turicibacter sanguinis]|uniref:helix-turn-helix domain-containing protein n=1 Tax=Turicibacter sanguinis TaxID=154288 RepID=UPI0018AB6959|nr:helix-turn-helix transcriptional regulator [Turicibacter sanguinis]MDB8574025.1 helix-turn-helix transcriptional regulator [Turicibacter sanguinis]MDB8576788.1 helix-turn-helix transcriptional regulator [Turicibacter sanguinis]MDB8582818.1 helix-turn-helix transcriptional regulator [Turicibacter sanguinis]MDB8587250.1 helix-turn-helix transcriptional regulator [Turicibacter sanguinis]MDB8596572.1 helix-turn-helix transcriptional regulator [Turicibacter sanguinis]